jgi:hypothetical protein
VFVVIKYNKTAKWQQMWQKKKKKKKKRAVKVSFSSLRLINNINRTNQQTITTST